SRLQGHRGVKGAHRRSEAGFPWAGRQGTRDAKRRNAPAHYPRPRQTAKVKEIRKLESRMMRQIFCQISHGQDVKVREMRSAETLLHIIHDRGKRPKSRR